MTENLPPFLTTEEREIVTDDIPEALRDTPIPAPPAAKASSPGWGRRVWLGLGLVLMTIMAIMAAIALSRTEGLLPTLSSEAGITSETNENELLETSSEATDQNGEPTPLLGHFAYEEAPPEELVAINADGTLQLRKMAAIKFQQMVNAAQRDGVSLVPLSAFRTLKDQEYLFFEVKAQRGEMATQRAEVSAPPGYSEHHTGYAVDIGDGYVPSVDLSPEFENTAAFKWLERNAAYYSFELSFPRDNPQGIAYEPWHWRFVGDRHSLETFYHSRQQQQPTP